MTKHINNSRQFRIEFIDLDPIADADLSIGHAEIAGSLAEVTHRWRIPSRVRRRPSMALLEERSATPFVC